MESNVDQRVQRTQRLLARALIELVLEKPYEQISIREITQRAGVGYATFFRHYPDQHALLHEVLEVVLDELLGLLLQPETSDDSLAVGLVLFRYVERNGELCRVLLGGQGSWALRRRMVEIGTQSALERYNLPESAPVPGPILAHHVVISSIALIQWWLDQGMPYPPERMATIYQALIAAPAERLG